MDDKRQKNQKYLASNMQGGGEASSRVMRGSESFEVVGETESLAMTEYIMEEVLSTENLKEALSKVMKNGGAAGIDGMTVDKLPAYLKDNWKRIRRELMEGTYAPQAVRRKEIPKVGEVRQLGIPTVVSFCTSCSFLLG